MKTFITLLLAAAAGAYALLWAKPGLYFANKTEYRGFTVRARGPLPESVAASLDAAVERISAAELYKEDMKFDLYLPATTGQLRFFAPLVKGEYFRVNPLNGAIFLAAADFGAGEARKRPGDAKFRSLSGVIAGAAAYEMTRRRVRPLTYLFMNEWKVRGYAEKLSGGTGEFSTSDACGEPSSAEQLDYKYGLMLETVMKEDNISYGDLLDRNFSRQNAEQRVMRAYCGG